MTIFSQIICGKIPSYKVAEDESFYAFLDINPVQLGHTLVVPKREEDYFFDLSDDELSAMMIFAKRVAKAIQKATGCTKVAMAVVGLEVNHAHIHLIPVNQPGDCDLQKHVKVSSSDLMKMSEEIRLVLK